MKTIFFLIIISFYLNGFSQNIIYVSNSGADFIGVDNHKSWASATKSLQKAINALSEKGGVKCG